MERAKGGKIFCSFCRFLFLSHLQQSASSVFNLLQHWPQAVKWSSDNAWTPRRRRPLLLSADPRDWRWSAIPRWTWRNQRWSVSQQTHWLRLGAGGKTWYMILKSLDDSQHPSKFPSFFLSYHKFYQHFLAPLSTVLKANQLNYSKSHW